MDFPNIDSFDPRTCISGKIRRINLMTSAIFQKHYGDLGVTNSQTSILFVLSKTEGKSQKELCDILVLEKSSMNRNLKRLVEQEYITREDFPKMKITTKGKELVELIVPRWRKAMEEIREIIGEDGEQSVININTQLLNHRNHES